MSTKMDTLSLPDVAIIRKGDAKIEKEGKTTRPGPDLRDRFRVVFRAGAEEYEKIFLSVYKTEKPERIRAMVLSQSVWDSWTWANEAYNAGRMVAKADDTHYIFKRNPTTGVVEVQDGEPFTPFKPGDCITYTYVREGKPVPVSLKVKTNARLRLFLPELGRLVQFTLKTTSYYDRMQIEQQLASIQAMSNDLNHGNAAGVPFFIYRMPQEITWNKPEGGAQRVEKWLINIEADPDWVRAAVQRLAGFALTGEMPKGYLMPPTPVQLGGSVDPGQEETDENPLDAEFTDVTDEGQEPPAPPEPTPQPQSTAEKKPTEQKPADRPLSPDMLRDMLIRRASSKSGEASPQQVGLTVSMMEQVFAPAADAAKIRHFCTEYLFGVKSTKELKGGQIKALLDWLKPIKDSGGAYLVDPMAAQELKTVWTILQKVQGQTTLPGIEEK